MKGKFLRSLTYYGKRLERRGFVGRLRNVADYIVEIAGSRQYTGENPAIRAVHSPLRVSLLVMLALFFCIFILGTLVPIESAAVAHGTIVVMSNKKTVQHLEGGIIREILVKDGDLVKENQPLIELNNVAPKANEAIVKSDLYAARVTEARLIALRDDKEEMSIDPEIVKEAETSNPGLAKTMDTQKDLFRKQRETYKGKLETLRQRIEQANQEIIGLSAQVKSAEGQLALIAQEVGPMERLVEKGFAAKPQLLNLKRQQEELGGNRGQYLAAIAKARQSMTETELQIDNLKNESATQTADELRDVQSRIADSEEKLRAALDVVERSVITAPYEGIVTGLKYHTIGGVIAAGTPIMDIIPQADKLVVEAQVMPSDIDVVRPGLDTRIVFTAYKTRNFPTLMGKVVNVSADSFNPQQAGQNAPAYFTAKVEVDNEEFARLDTQIKLYPGMQVEIFIRTGSRSFLSYLLSPITSSLRRAFKED